MFFGMTNFVPLGFTQIQSVSFCPVDFRFLYLDVFIYSNTVRNATYKYRLEITPMAFFLQIDREIRTWLMCVFSLIFIFLNKDEDMF